MTNIKEENSIIRACGFCLKVFKTSDERRNACSSCASEVDKLIRQGIMLSFIPKSLQQRIKELEERTNVIKRRTVKPTGEIIRQEAEEEYNQMKKIEQQIKERQEKIGNY